jgi:hypothetical protein
VPAQDNAAMPNVIPFPVQRHPASGIYIWVIETDMVCGDDAVAGLFGFDAAQLRSGLPLKLFLERIYAADLPRVAKAIHDAMITGFPYQEDYRINRPDGSSADVTAFGSCFRNGSGEPSHYGGMIVPAVAAGTAEDDLLDLCLKTYATAASHGRLRVAQKLLEALAAIDAEDDCPAEPSVLRIND